MPRAAYPPRHADPVAAVPSPSEEDEDEDDEEEEFDLIEVMNEMPVNERRKVYALKGLFGDYKAIRAELRRELAQLQRENHAAVQRLNAIRSEIVRGVRDITEDELAAVQSGSGNSVVGDTKNKKQHDTKEEEEEAKKKAVKVMSPGDTEASSALREAAASPSGGIPDFWLTALLNTEVFEAMITERDRAALHFLQDIHVDFIENDPNKGVTIYFDFASNPFFTNTTLTKTYHMEFNEEDGETEIGKIKGCTIDWTSPKNNLTVVVKQKKQRNKNTKQIRVVERVEPCESFFNFFTAPKDPNESDSDDDEGEGDHADKAGKEKKPKPHNDDDDEDDDEDFYEQEVEVDIEAGQALMEMVVPKAAYYYTGKSVEDIAREICKHYGMDFEGNDDDDDEEEEDEEEEDEGNAAGGVNFRAMVGRHKGNAEAAKEPQAAKKGGAAAAQPQECKQQ